MKMRLTSHFTPLLALIFGTLAFISEVSSNDEGKYTVGVGIADITGPVADIMMMGYANSEQSARGLHIRLFSRAFYFESEGEPPVVFVSGDIQSVDQAVKFKVVERLQAKYGDKFTEKNVLLSGTHTHSGPGAFLQYLLYGITSLGFNQPSFNAIVSGMVESIDKAYSSRVPGRVFINSGMVEGANINRSPTSYEENPQWERDLHEKDGGDVDKNMVLLRIEAENGTALGSINWFAVHPTSMNNTNKLVSGDNKGYASQLFEKKMNPEAMPGKGKFVAAFASTNLGDVSPNTAGSLCRNNGKPCESKTSTCEGDNLFVKHCIAFGDGTDMEDSTKINGERQFAAAHRIFEDKDNAELLRGPTGHVFQYVNMTNYEIIYVKNGTKACMGKSTCNAALGFSFAAGTTDGPGMFNFVQGDTKEKHIFWDIVKGFIKKPSYGLIQCQKPKPILLAVGETHFPYDWVASSVETQILRVGNLYILGFPGELTTMAGRRLRRTIEEVLNERKGWDVLDCRKGRGNSRGTKMEGYRSRCGLGYKKARSRHPGTFLKMQNQDFIDLGISVITYYKPEITPGLRGYQGTSAVFKVNGPGFENVTHPSWSPKHKEPAKIRNPTEFWRALTFATKA